MKIFKTMESGGRGSAEGAGMQNVLNDVHHAISVEDEIFFNGEELTLAAFAIEVPNEEVAVVAEAIDEMLQNIEGFPGYTIRTAILLSSPAAIVNAADDGAASGSMDRSTPPITRHGKKFQCKKCKKRLATKQSLARHEAIVKCVFRQEKPPQPRRKLRVATMQLRNRRE